MTDAPRAAADGAADQRPTTNRRALLGLIGASAALGMVQPVGAAAPSAGPLAPPADQKLVRLSSVVTPEDGGLYNMLLPDFNRQTGYRIELATSDVVYEPARAGRADVVLSHYGHHDIRAFMEDGLGEWPQTVFSNQHALIGPETDPAKIRGDTDLVAAFAKIATAKAPYVVNDSDGLAYLSAILWEAAGRPSKEGWYLDGQARGPEAAALASEKQAYVIWGLTPFFRTQRAGGGGGGGGGRNNPGGGAVAGAGPALANLWPLVLADPLLQRIMVTVAVRADKIAGVNSAGAKVFQQYLLAPRTQAMIRAFRLPGTDAQIWWPAGHANAGGVLPVGSG